MQIVNLARRPFVNVRPVRRTATLLWTIGILLLITNVWLYRDFWKSSAEIRGQLTALDAKIRQEQAALSELDKQLVALDLDDQNLQVMYLNRLITYRTFPWSALFDQLVEVLPSDVRLTTVRPEVRLGDDARLVAERRAASARRRTAGRRSRQASTQRAVETGSFDDQVALQLTGVAKGDEELLKFIDALYEDPTFSQPVLISEQRDPKTQLISFTVTAVYLTRQPEEEDADAQLAALSGDEASEASSRSSEGSTREQRLVDEDADRTGAVGVLQGGPESAGRTSSTTATPSIAGSEEPPAAVDQRVADRAAIPSQPSRGRSTPPPTASSPPSTSRRVVPPVAVPDPTTSRPTTPRATVPRSATPRTVPPRTVPPRTVPRSEQDLRPPRSLVQPQGVRPNASSAQRLEGLRPFAESWWPQRTHRPGPEASS